MQAPADSARERAAPPSNELPLWRRIMPFVVGGGLAAYVLSRLDFPTFIRAVKGQNLVGFVAVALTFNVILILADVYATTYVYRRAIAPVKYKELLIIRAAAYLPSMVNHH